MKSAKEVEKTAPPPSIATTDDTAREGGKGKDVSCVEILQSRIPLIRSILDVFGGGGYGQRKKRENVTAPNDKVLPPKASTAYLLLTDGSCAPSLQVLSHYCSVWLCTNSLFLLLECLSIISNINTHKHFKIIINNYTIKLIIFNGYITNVEKFGFHIFLYILMLSIQIYFQKLFFQNKKTCF